MEKTKSKSAINERRDAAGWVSGVGGVGGVGRWVGGGGSGTGSAFLLASERVDPLLTGQVHIFHSTTWGRLYASHLIMFAAPPQRCDHFHPPGCLETIERSQYSIFLLNA